MSEPHVATSVWLRLLKAHPRDPFLLDSTLHFLRLLHAYALRFSLFIFQYVIDYI